MMSKKQDSTFENRIHARRHALIGIAWCQLFSCLVLFSAQHVFAQEDGSSVEIGALGSFTDHGDVGQVKHAGSVSYDATLQTYEVSGSGANMWFDEDQFHFVWKKMKGDFTLRARAELLGQGVDPHRKMGWMVRSSLETDSPYVDVAIHGDGLTSMQFRRTPGAETEEKGSSLSAPDVIQLSKLDGRYTMSVAKYGDTLESEQLTGVDLGDEVYVGLFVCSHNADVVEKARFSNVRIIVPAPADHQPYRDYYSSRLEIMDVVTGHRRVVHTTADSMQAPNWTLDGKTLIYNRNGKLYRFDIATGQVETLDTGFANKNNNDHVLSMDGKQLGISHHSAEHGGRSVIYTLPIRGGVPKLVTANTPSYLHGWSPDGQHLVYTGGRNDQYDIYKISVNGGQEVRLTNTSGVDDGAEYSPDGQHIYFNSSRTGKMKLWKMKADGSDPEQLTDDPYQDWFPHLSPDGKHIVFLSFRPDVDADDHPFYKHVYLRQVSIQGGKPKVIAYVYGGQGTINVPSWSPDGRRVAFVSNSAD